MTITRRDLSAAVLVLAVAAFFRFGRADIVEYFHDDAMLATLALELADGARFPWTGILSSTGIPNSPLSVYILAFPFAVSADPYFVIHFVMLLNVLGAGLLWCLALRCLGERAALIAGLAYAVSPWAVLFSRKLWAQEIHTPILLLALLLLLHGFWPGCRSAHRGRAVAVAQCLGLPLFVAAAQIHFAALSLTPMLPLILWQGRRRIIRPALVIGIALSIMSVVPFAVGLRQTLSLDPQRLTDALDRSSERGISPSLDAIAAAVQLASGSGLEHWLAPDQADVLADQLPAYPQMNLIPLVLVAVGVWAVFRRSTAFASLLLMWAFLPFATLLLAWTPVYIHYFIPSIPALMLLLALGADHLLRLSARARWPTFALFAALAAIAGAQTLQWQTVLNFVADRHIDYPGFTTPMRSLLPLRDRLRPADDVVIIGGGMSWNLHHEVAVWDTLLWQDVSCVRTIAPDGYAVFPAHPFAVVIAPEAGAAPANGLYENETVERFPTRPGGADFLVYRWETAPAWPGPAIEPLEPQAFSNGARLTGYGLDSQTVVLEWRLPSQQIGLDFQFSVQAYDNAGARIAQRDATFWHGRHWCEGDRLLTWLPLQLDDAAATIKVAMYRLGQGSDEGAYFPADVLDAMGNAKGQSVDIPLH